MEEYREKLKVQNIIIAIGCVVLALVSVLAVINELGVIHIMPATGDSHFASMWNGFVCGASAGLLGAMIFGLVRNIRAMNSEKELKKRYVKDHDERQIQIWTAARAASMQAFLILGLVAGIVAGYFNMTVSITIIACITINAFLGLGFKLYYSTKY